MSQNIAVVDNTIERVVNMKLYGIDDNDICAACSIDSEQLVLLVASDEYKAKFADQTVEQFEEGKTLNDAWDSIEAQSLSVINDVLKFSRDPEFALKAAVASNRATRRGAKNDHQIPANMGARAVINLSATFIDKLQANVNLNSRNGDVEQKQQDFLDPKKLESLLGLNDKKDDRVEGMLHAACLTIAPEVS